jgi:chromosome segregation ATPase
MGFFDNLFNVLKGKNPNEEWDEQMAREDTKMQSSEEIYTPQEDSSVSRGGRSTGQIQVEIERLWGQLAATREQLSVAGEHSNRLNEEIGEVRAIAIEQEKNSNDLKIQAERAASLVESVQPDMLRKEIRRLDARLDEMAGINEKLERMQQTVMDEMRLMRERMEVVRGGETLLNLNEEVKGELNSVRKLESLTAQHADSVESIYLDTQKGLSEIKAMKETITEAHGEISTFANEIAQIRKRLNTSADQAQVTHLDEALRKLDSRSLSTEMALKSSEKAIAQLTEKASWVDERISALSDMGIKGAVPQDPAKKEDVPAEKEKN